MLSLNEIRNRAIAFAKEWEGVSNERAESQSFWNNFFDVFGITRRRVASFEKPVKKQDGRQGFIDLLWKGVILVEHKSRGEDLSKAEKQAFDYFPGLSEKDLPRFILVSDFERFCLHDLDEDKKWEFTLAELPKKIELFGFISGYEKQELVEEDPVNRKAAELMGELHDELAKIGYGGHDLEVFLVRVLFCLFAEDAQGIFEERGAFSWYIKNKTEIDGSDLGAKLDQIFEVLNTPKAERLTTLDETLANFPYINGGLYDETLRKTAFNRAMRDKLLKCCNFAWERISPAVFGSLFQYVMDPKLRRDLGAHYTDEQNILKVIKPLFLDDLWAEFKRAEKSPKSLKELHEKLGQLKFFDPACGCGNFLVITYREIRKIELEILKILHKKLRSHSAHVAKFDVKNLLKVDVDNFYGIEIAEFSVRVAEVAMWLMDHQMNELVGSELGQAFARIPLKKSANIHHANSLRIDWNEVLPAKKCSFIISNPPFYGHHLQTLRQKEDVEFVFHQKQGMKVLDYVSCWYKKAVEYIQNSEIEVAFVSTNSITQGEQVGILWDDLLATTPLKINFAHQTFKWTNQAKGKAQVFVVIIGFGLRDRKRKFLFEYDDVRGKPHKIKVKNINPYLVEGNNVIVRNRTKPLCDIPTMSYGNKATDGGNFILSKEEKNELLKIEPQAKKWVRRYIGARDFLHNEERWCLWLEGISPSELRQLPEVMKRVEKIKKIREESKAASTREYARFPILFRQNTQPKNDYILVPSTSSERRNYIPIGFFPKEIILSNASFAVPNATLFHFGVLTSEMHMSWTRSVCGRLKGDFRYSKDIVYNNFPWPDSPTAAKIKKVEVAVQKILDTRAKYPNSSLADLYDPLTMPPDLVKAHTALDKAVDLCYRPQPFTKEADRVAFLFERYEELIKIRNEE